MTVQDSGYYSLLVNGLSPEEQINLQSLMVLAEQKKAQIQSKQIERQGGKVDFFLRCRFEQLLEVEIIFFSILQVMHFYSTPFQHHFNLTNPNHHSVIPRKKNPHYVVDYLFKPFNHCVDKLTFFLILTKFPSLSHTHTLLFFRSYKQTKKMFFFNLKKIYYFSICKPQHSLGVISCILLCFVTN